MKLNEKMTTHKSITITNEKNLNVLMCMYTYGTAKNEAGNLRWEYLVGWNCPCGGR